MVSDGTRQAFEAAEMMFFGIMTDITSHKTVHHTNYLTEMCSGSEAGSYLRRIDFVYDSTLGLRVITR